MHSDVRQRVTILGSTGSIGVNTLDVLERHPDRFEVFALTAHRNIERLVDQCLRYRPRYAVLTESTRAGELREQLALRGVATEVLTGLEALQAVASAAEVDIVMAAIVGGAGLLPTLAAAQSGKRVLLANKEALVMAGRLFMQAVAHSGATLLPIDSEHNAIFQCMPTSYRTGMPVTGVERIILTASGGPFREYPADLLAQVTPQQACAHPNWVMGRKISVDSATLMNKGLEVIEACWLFNMHPDRIDVVVHPQSVIHSLVAYVDGSVLAQLGQPDMRTPIAHALAWPERFASGVQLLDLIQVARFDFAAPDVGRFPCLRLAFAAARAGGFSSVALNAANEIAVDAFLREQIRFTAIPALIEDALAAMPSGEPDSLEQVIDCDHETRQRALSWISRHQEVSHA